MVNGEKVTQMGVSIDEDYDEVKVDGEVVRAESKKMYIMLNKPVGFVTTVSDDKGRPTVLDLVSDISLRIYPVGRLDYDTEGLLLLRILFGFLPEEKSLDRTTAMRTQDLTIRLLFPIMNPEKSWRGDGCGLHPKAVNGSFIRLMETGCLLLLNHSMSRVCI
jgi:hypothetical protein